MGILMTFRQVGRPKETVKFPHLKGREQLLRPLGFTPQQAEWITLVCLHSGLFTRDQVEAFFGYAKSSANRFIRTLLRTRISHKPIASEAVTDGRRICRIFGKQIYGELEIPPIRHRRETSLEVTRRRLLSLDFVLDHPELSWLPTEQEKVACFEQLGIEPWMLPRRIYAGQAKGRVQYFPLRMPVAMGPEAAVFVYTDPGMGTRTELHSWGAAPLRTLGKSSGNPAAASSWLRSPGSSTCWTAPSVFFSPGAGGPSPTPRKKSSRSSWPSIMAIGRPSNLMVASMPP